MKIERITVRAWPKMIFSWPSALAAIVCGFLTQAMPENGNYFGLIFFMVFTMNLVVLSFEFNRTASMSLVLFTIAAVFGLVLGNQTTGFIGPIKQWIGTRELSAAPQFYFSMGVTQILMYVGMFITTRFDYWQLSQNELIHKTGIFGDLERYSTAGIKVNKEITDIFEYLIGGAGRLILFIPGQSTPVILDNVIGIRKIEKAAAQLLNARVVRVEQPSGFREAENG